MKTMNVEEIMKLLPHRYPMLMIDRVIEHDIAARRIVCLKNVTANEPYFQGHFPGAPVMPGILQLEAMAQAGGILLNLVVDLSGRVSYFMSIDKAKFRRVVVPGDQLRIEAELLKVRSTIARFRARALVDGAVASEAEMLCMITDREAGQ